MGDVIKFLVVIAFTFHGQQGKIHVPVRAGSAEIATRYGFRAAQTLACLYEGKVTRCVGPGSYAVTTTVIGDDGNGICGDGDASSVMFVRTCGE